MMCQATGQANPPRRPHLAANSETSERCSPIQRRREAERHRVCHLRAIADEIQRGAEIAALLPTVTIICDFTHGAAEHWSVGFSRLQHSREGITTHEDARPIVGRECVGGEDPADTRDADAKLPDGLGARGTQRHSNPIRKLVQKFTGYPTC